MRNEKKQNEQPQPGLWPVESKHEGLEQSILLYTPNNKTKHDHLKRFLDYIDMADLSMAMATLTKMYFSCTEHNYNVLNKEEVEEFVWLIHLFADLSTKEHSYIKEDRENLLKELYEDN